MVQGPATISVVVIQEGEWWSAQCLQYDIAAQAKTIEDLQHELAKTLLAYMVLSKEKGVEPLSDIEPAPQKYWDMYKRAWGTVTGDTPPLRLPEAPPMPIPVPILKLFEDRRAVQ